MKDELIGVTYTIELKPGEKLSLPPALVDSVGPGRWIVNVQPCSGAASVVRRHDAFLHGFAAEDEGLYEDIAR